MFSKQVIFLLFTVLLIGPLASAAPTPVTVEKKVLKQLKLKRGDPKAWMGRNAAPNPSGYLVKRNKPTKAKRNEPSSPKPSKGYRKA